MKVDEKLVGIKPQELFAPRHLVAPIEVVAGFLKITVEDLRERLAQESGDLKLVRTPEGEYVEYVAGRAK